MLLLVAVAERCYSPLHVSGIYWDHELETMPWPQVEAWQAQRVAAFLPSLVARSSFYAAMFGGGMRSMPRVDSFSSLSNLPFTTKHELRTAQDSPRTGYPLGANQSAPLNDLVQIVASSGTTGKPMYYGLTRRDLEVWTEAIAATYFTTGIRPGDVIAHLVALPMVAGGLPYADGFRRIGATLAWLGGFPVERILDAIPLLQVSAILATTSFGLYLAEDGQRARALKVSKYISGGEPGLQQPEIRKKIQDGWGASHIREVMGLGDVLSAMWGECDRADGMHFNAQRSVAVELVEPLTGEPVRWENGARGEAVYTTCDREATPVLRYRSADHVVVTGTSCACGRTSPKIGCIGRTDDMLIYKGMNVFASAIRDVVLERHADVVEPNVRIWKDTADQVRFDTAIPVEIEARAGVETDRLVSAKIEIEERIRQRLQVRVTVTFAKPGTIPRNAYKTALVQVRPSL